MATTETKLYNFFTTGDKFKRIETDRKAVLRLYLTEKNKFGFGVWQGGTTKYNEPWETPLFEFEPGDLELLNWEFGMFLGDQKIGKGKISEIKTAIGDGDPTKKFVILIAKKHKTFTNQIVFDITVGNSETEVHLKALTYTNPSPPRNSSKVHVTERP